MTDFTEAPPGALSPPMLDLQRRLLREVVRRSATYVMTGEVLPDAAPDIDAPQEAAIHEVAIETIGATRALSPLNAAFHHHGFLQPIAADMTPDEIAACIARGDDPWASAVQASGPIEDAPIRDLLAACALVRSFGAPGEPDELTAPGAITLIPVPTDDRRAALRFDLADILPTFFEFAGRAKADAPLNLMTFGSSVPERAAEDRIRRDRDGQVAAFEGLVAKNAPVLMLARSVEDLPEVARRLPIRTCPWPGPTTDDVVEILRVTQSHTGLLAEEAIRAALPAPERLATLDPLLWKRALTEASPIRAAHRVAEFCVAPAKAVGPTLADLHGQPLVRAELEDLLRDVADWRAGTLEWSEVTSSVLLTGPPGVGKTMAAAALAGSAGLPLVSTS